MIFVTLVIGLINMLMLGTAYAAHAHSMPCKFNPSYFNASEPRTNHDLGLTANFGFLGVEYSRNTYNTKNNGQAELASRDTVNRRVDSFGEYFESFHDPLSIDTVSGDHYLGDSFTPVKRNVALGTGLLTAEYVILPTIAYYTWWNEGFTWGNPLDYVDEKEPFLADNAWHMAGCNMLTEFHYRVMHGCFRSRHSVLFSTSLTLLTFTAVECLDALEKTHKWEFSLGDVFANVLGVGFWTFKHYYPNVPVSMRVGIRKWRDAIDLLEEAATAITDFEKFQGGDFDHYSILKVEGIYRFKPGLYCGVAISRKDAPSDENLWGITVGWDLIKALDRKGTRKSLLHTISEYVSIPISFTYWLD